MSNGFGSFGGGGGKNNANGNAGGFSNPFGGTPAAAQQPASVPGGNGVGRRMVSTVRSSDDREVTTDGRDVRLQIKDGQAEKLDSSGSCWIDGLCAFDPKSGEAARQRVIVWTTNRSKGVQVDGISAFNQPPVEGRNGEIEILTDMGSYVRVPGSIGRVVAVEDLFSPKGLVLYGDNGKTQAEPAVYPMAAEWIPCVKDKPKVRFEGGTLEYTLSLHGLEGSVVRRYTAAEIEVAGEPPDIEDPEAHLRVMVWPANPTPNWKLFVVDVGANGNKNAWCGKFQWSLYHHPIDSQSGRGAAREDERRVTACRSLRDNIPIVRRSEGAFDPVMPLRIATGDRPHYIEIGRIGETSVCGSFDLLPRMGAPGLNESSAAEDSQGESWGVDIGTSNSCLARLARDAVTQKNQTVVVNLNQVWDPQAPNDSLVLCRIGTKKAPRSDLHWMPGLEGATGREVIQSEAITQVPTRLALLVKPPKMPQALSAQEVRDMIPMCDVVVPPLQSRTTFGQSLVDERTVDRLKWVDKHEDKRVALLEQYVSCLLLMAAARIRPTGTVTVHFSQPLSFTDLQRQALELAAKAAAATVAEYSGVQFVVHVDSDESHCILEQFAALAKSKQPNFPVWVLCDIGGGSVDLAVATGTSEKDYAFMAADSIKFGANLVFANLLEIAGQQLANTPHVPTQRQAVRELIARSGFDSVLAKCNPNTKQQITKIVQCYYNLVAEYVARTVAGCLRNPKRFKGVCEASDGTGFDSVLEQPDYMTTELHVLVTGNGFRTFDVIAAGRTQTRLMQDFSTLVRDRVQELLRQPTGIPGEASEDDAWFAKVPGPITPSRGGYLGLEPRAGVVYLKEALAYSILASAGAGNSESRSARDYLASPNGLTEFSAGWPARRIPGAERPWYAFVGSKQMQRSVVGSLPFMVDTSEPWYVADPNVARDERTFGPAMPESVARVARDLRWNVDVNQMFQLHAAEIDQLLKDDDGNRQWSLLKLLYEVGMTRLFSSGDFLS